MFAFCILLIALITSDCGGCGNFSVYSSTDQSLDVFNHDLFAAIRTNGDNTDIIISNDRGVIFNSKFLSSSQVLSAVAIGAGKIVNISNPNYISAVSSDNGENWIQGSLPGSKTWDYIEFVNRIFLLFLTYLP
jgi:hypothetical protein